MKITAIITTHNRRKLSGEALQSVLVQSRPPDEIIVVDDASVDGTEPYLMKLVSQSPWRGKWRCLVMASRQGVSATRNLGIREAASEWLAFLDSDDLWLPDKLEEQERFHRGDPEAVWSYTDEIWWRDGRRVNPGKRHRKEGGWIFSRSLPLCLISASSALVRRDLLLGTVGLFDEHLPVCEDYDLWLRLSLRHKVGFIERPLIVKRNDRSREQLSRRYWGMDRFRARALIKLLGRQDLTGQERDEVIETLLDKCRILEQGAARRGRDQAAAYYRGIYHQWLPSARRVHERLSPL